MVSYDDVLDVILQLARNPAIADDGLRAAVLGVLERLEPDERAAVSERARELLYERQPRH